MLLPFIFNAIGGFAGIHAAVPAEKLSLVAPAEIGIFYIAIIAFNALVGIVAQPHVMGNCAAGRTELDGQVGFMGGNFLKRICTIAWTLTGVAAIAYFAQESIVGIKPDNVFGEVAYRFLPNIMPGLLGLFIAGLLASVMSSCDAFMIATSGLFTENIYKKLRPGKSDKHYLLTARIASLGIVAAGVIYAFLLRDVIQGLEIFWKVASMMGIAFWIGLFWRKMNTAGAWAATLSAFGMWWVTTQTFFIKFTASWPVAESLKMVASKLVMVDGVEQTVQSISLPWQMIFYLTVGFLMAIIVSLITRKPDEKKLDLYYSLIRTPVKEGEKLGEPCTIPADSTTLPSRKLLPCKSLEIYVPKKQMVIGFLVGWAGVALLIWVMFALLAK